ncbi:hypothetical protein BDC45DRAFT_611416 [Circinella umbellata]|nr:hypothetical protein BDC45DRAFT_611416 [Circinella umbellata]
MADQEKKTLLENLKSLLQMNLSHRKMRQVQQLQMIPVSILITRTTDCLNEPKLSEPVRTLKEAFPETDVEVIEAILVAQGNSVERSFEALLGMSDPNYKPEEQPRSQQQHGQQQGLINLNDDTPTPDMPPRPTSDRETTTQAPYGYWQQPQQPQEPRSVEEQMRMDEEFARQLALQDERSRVQQYRQQQQQQQQQQEDDQPLFNFQEDLPIIKERVIEAGNVAKKKVMDLYNQFKASREGAVGSPNQGVSSQMPTTTNAQYRGLPSDEGDDLLAGDVSALRLSDNDVYAQTTRPTSGQQRGGVIHVNPPLGGQNQNVHVDQQIRADEELARRLAQEDQFWESSRENSTPPQMPPRRSTPSTSPIAGNEELEGESVTLTAPASTQSPATKKSEEGTEERRSYVIQDEDDSDDDDLVDVDADDLQKKDDKPHEKTTSK